MKAGKHQRCWSLYWELPDGAKSFVFVHRLAVTE